MIETTVADDGTRRTVETWWVLKNDVGQWLVSARYKSRTGFEPKWLHAYDDAILFPTLKSAQGAKRAAVHSGAKVFRRVRRRAA